MKVRVRGGPELVLGQREYLGAGGEGAVYARGSRAYKVYHDPARMLPLGKIGELGAIAHPQVIKPEEVLLDQRGHPVGYGMRLVTGTVTLCQLFPRAFRERNGVTPGTVLDLVRQLRAGMEGVHAARVLVVDCNELNFLVSGDLREVYFIDADSYQTPGFPATAIMASVRDPRVRGHEFTEASDWFSWGVVSFQLLTGIHPYKGKYKGARGELRGAVAVDDPGDAFAVTRRRMEAGVSVLNADVSVPKVVYAWDSVVPRGLLRWFASTFEQGLRSAPPVDFDGVVAAASARLVKSVTGAVTVEALYDLPSGIRGLWETIEGRVVAVCEDGVYVDRRRVRTLLPRGVVAGVVSTPISGRPVLATLVGTSLTVDDLGSAGPAEVLPLRVEQAASSGISGSRLLLKSGDSIYELVVIETVGGSLLLSSRRVANCMERATALFPGVAVQDLLGKTHLTLLTDGRGTWTIPVPELDGYRVVAARMEGNVVMVLGMRGGQYDRLVFRFSRARDAYDVRVVPAVTPTGLNFVVLDSGVVATLTEDEALELSSAGRGGGAVKRVEDEALGGDLQLRVLNGGKVHFFAGPTVGRLTVAR